jgi:hypothetical protein
MAPINSITDLKNLTGRDTEPSSVIIYDHAQPRTLRSGLRIVDNSQQHGSSVLVRKKDFAARSAAGLVPPLLVGSSHIYYPNDRHRAAASHRVSGRGRDDGMSANSGNVHRQLVTDTTLTQVCELLRIGSDSDSRATNKPFGEHRLLPTGRMEKAPSAYSQLSCRMGKGYALETSG